LLEHVKAEIKILEMTNSTKRITENRTVMDFVVDFITSISNKLRKQELRDINCVRLYKRIVELVGVDGKDSTNAYMNNKE